MANDWIKMRNNLASDPAVIGLAAQTKLDVFSVVGRLHTLWVWADEQSEDGFLQHVKPAIVDDKVRRRGFSLAMTSVGWLVIEEGGIRFPKFGRHNGESAKIRALASERQRDKRERDRHKSVTDASRETCDNSVTREEESREEKSRVIQNTDNSPTTENAASLLSDLADTTPVVLIFPCVGQQDVWPLPESLLNRLRELYPTIDPLAECKLALGKIETGAVTKKTARGMARFLFAWMDRSSNRKLSNAGGNERRASFA